MKIAIKRLLLRHEDELVFEIDDVGLVPHSMEFEGIGYELTSHHWENKGNTAVYARKID